MKLILIRIMSFPVHGCIIPKPIKNENFLYSCFPNRDNNNRILPKSYGWPHDAWGQFCTGFMYTHDQWTNYYEGKLKRDNMNIGQVTTQALIYMGNYGVNDRLNIIGMLPYIKTNASEGTLMGMSGLQDLSLGVKYNYFNLRSERMRWKNYAVFNFSTPLSNYSPDFLPLSIGLGTTNLQYRLTSYLKHTGGLFFNVSPAFVWRSNTTLDRSAYFDGEKLYMSNEVRMPHVFDLFVSVGYLKGNLQAEFNLMQQNTLGGHDIRRQDMPFVSNRMNFTRPGALIMYYLPWHENLAIRASVNHTVTGRNVGSSTTFLGGILYTFHFPTKSQPE